MNAPEPKTFVQWAYDERAALLRRLAAGERIPREQMFLGFTRHNPTVVSYGPAGPNGAIKGVGWMPRPEYLEETLAAYDEHIRSGWREGYGAAGMQILLQQLYGEESRERVDFERLGSLELAKGHSWTNLSANPRATLVFYEPPVTSYEVRAGVEIHEPGSPYHRLLNMQHDVYHEPHPERWAERPAYVFHIEEIYDNSARPGGFGTQLVP